MGDGIDMGKGLSRVLRRLIPTEGFVRAVLGLLLGKEGSAASLDMMLRDESYGQTLNEVVAVHRALKDDGKETGDTAGKDMGLLRRIAEIPERSLEFQSEVIAKTLRKPGAAVALIKLVRSGGKDPKAWAVVAKAVVESVGEVTGADDGEEKEKSPYTISEAAVANTLRRAFRHASRAGRRVNEETGDRYGGRMPVNVYTGRFQPFHLGHLSNLQAAAERGLRTVICPVMAGKTPKSIAGHPFNGKIEEEMFSRLKSAYGDLIADIIPIARPSLDCWVEAVRERGMEPITWTTGADRKPSYENIIAKYGPDFNLVDNFEVIGLDKDMDAEGGNIGNTAGISGTAIRKCLVDGNEDGFKEQMPECLWDMYGEFRNALMTQASPAGQPVNEETVYDIVRAARAGAVSESKRRFFEQLRKDLDSGLMNVMG